MLGGGRRLGVDRRGTLTTPHRGGALGRGDRGRTSRGGGDELPIARRVGAGRKLSLEEEVDDGIPGLRPIGALPTEAGALRIAGQLQIVVVGLAEDDPRAVPLGGIGGEQAARLQPPFVLAELADVENIPRPEREPVENRAVACVGMLAADPDVDLSDPVALPLGDVVNEVELARLLEESGIGADVGEHEPAAAIDVANQPEIGIHLRLIKGLAALQLEVAGEELALELAVSDERDVADVVPRPLADHERQQRPVAAAAVHHLELAADLCLEEPEAPVVGRDQIDVLVNLVAVDLAADEPEDSRLRLDLRHQPGVAGDRVADEIRPQRFLALPLVDEEHGPLVAGLAPLDRRHLRAVKALLVVIGFEPAAGLLDDIRVHRVADVDLRLLPQRPGGDPLVADILHVAEHRPLDDLEDHHDSLGDPHRLRADIDELPAPVEGADVLLDRLHVEDLAGPGDELGELRDLGGMIPLDPDLDDPVRFVDGRQRSRWGGGLGAGRLGAGERGRDRGGDDPRRHAPGGKGCRDREAGRGGGWKELPRGLTDRHPIGRQAEEDPQDNREPPDVSAARRTDRPRAGGRLQTAEI